MREEERVIKGGSSTFIPSKFCLSLAIIFKDYCLFLYLRVAGLFWVLNFVVIVVTFLLLTSGRGWLVLGSSSSRISLQTVILAGLEALIAFLGGWAVLILGHFSGQKPLVWLSLDC